MPSTPTDSLRLEKQGQGENLNTWGDTKLNNVIGKIDKAIAGREAIAMTGDYTLSTANYSEDEASAMILDLSGALFSPVNLIVPAVSKSYVVRNQTGQVVTVKTAAGSGYSVPNGSTVQVMVDGSDVTLVRGNDVVTTTDLNAAVATATIPAASGAVKISANDTGSNFLVDALVAGNNIAFTEENDGGAETLSASIIMFEARYNNLGTKTAEVVALDWSADTIDQIDVAGNATITFSNIPSTGIAAVKALKLLNGGAHSVAWPAAVRWDNDSVPALATGSGQASMVWFYTDDGGARVAGKLIIGKVDLS